MASPQSSTSYSEPQYAKAQDRLKVPFYTPDVASRLVPEVRNRTPTPVAQPCQDPDRARP